MGDEKVLLREFAALGNQQIPSCANLHEVLKNPSQNISLTAKEAYNVAYKHARRLECSMAEVLSETDKVGRTPMYLAVRTSNHQAMKLFLRLGAPINAGNVSNGWSPLLLACWMRDMEAMEMLIAHGADVDHQCSGESGFTPLAAAAAREDLEVCGILIAAGASPAKAEHLMRRSNSPMKKDIIDFIHKNSTRRLSILGDKARFALEALFGYPKVDWYPSHTSAQRILMKC